MGLKEQAAVGVRWTMLGTVGAQVLNFGTLAILARELGPKAFGIVAIASIWTRFLNYFLAQGLGIAIIQRKDLHSRHLDSAFWLTMAMGGSLATITALSSPLAAQFFREPDLSPILQVLSLMFVLGGLSSIQSAILTRDRRFKNLAARDLIGTFTGSITSVILALLGAGIWALIAKQLVVASAVAAALWTASSWRPSFRFSYPHLKELWDFSINVFARNIVGFFYLEADKFIAGRLIGATELGFYSNAKQLARIVVNTTRKPIQTVSLPLLSQFQDNSHRIAETICKSQQMIGVMLIPIFSGIASLAPEIVAVIFGPDWQSAALPLQYLSFAEAINACSAVAFTSIMAIGRPRLGLLHMGISAASTIVAALIGSRWGIVGISIAMLANAFVYTISFVAILTKATHISPSQFVRCNLPAIISSIALSTATIIVTRNLLLGFDLWARTSTGIVTGTLVYAATLRIVSKESFETARNIGFRALGLKKSTS